MRIFEITLLSISIALLSAKTSQAQTHWGKAQANARVIKGIEYGCEGDFKVARFSFEQALLFDKHNLIASNYLNLLNSAFTHRVKKQTLVHLFKAINYTFDRNEYTDAMKEVNKAIELDPYYARSYHVKGFVYHKMGNSDLEIEEISNAIELDSLFDAAYVERGVAYYNKKDYEKAIFDLNKAIQIDSKNWDAYNFRGLAYFGKGLYKRAITDYDKAIKINPECAEAYLYKGLAYEKLRSIKDAFLAYNDFLQTALLVDNADNIRIVKQKLTNFLIKPEKNNTFYPYGGIPDVSRYETWTKDDYWRSKVPISFSVANFVEMHFLNNGEFGGAQFHCNAYFDKTKFEKNAGFGEAIFDSIASFSFTEFKEGASFGSVKFNNIVNFSSTKFNYAVFNNTKFKKSVSFNKSDFHKLPGEFYFAEFEDIVDFRWANFDGSANFSTAKFNKYADFSNSTFYAHAKGDPGFDLFRANFYQTNFNDGVSFSGAIFESMPDFKSTTFKGVLNLSNVEFKQGVDFRYADFDSIKMI